MIERIIALVLGLRSKRAILAIAELLNGNQLRELYSRLQDIRIKNGSNKELIRLIDDINEELDSL